MKKKIIVVIFSILIIIFFVRILLFTIPSKRLTEFENSNYSIKFYDRNGILLRFVPSEDGVWKIYTKLENIPNRAVKTVIKSEDKRFYYHFGVDFFSIARAFFQNIRGEKIISGGSTITMQLSRIIYPHKSGIVGKIYEIIRAYQIECKKSKKWILEQYINNIPFGYNTAGYPTASISYFNKDIKELSEEELAILAVIPRAPTKYNPFRNKEHVEKAAITLLKRIDSNFNINEVKRALNSIEPREKKFEAPHFINYIKSILRAEFKKDIVNNISEINTTIDISLQKNIENIVFTQTEKYRNNRLTNASVIVINNTNSEILGYVGSRDFFNEEISGQIDGVRINNQPGSTLKPFLYALALENGFSANTILPDIEINLGGEENYKPNNYNLRTNGPVRFRVALSSSLNIPAVYLLNRIGVKNFTSNLKQLNFNSLTKTNKYPGIGLALGNSDVKLYELAEAFTVFANSGVLQKTKPIKRIKIRDDDYIDFSPELFITNKYLKQYESKKVYSEETAFLIFDILSDNKSRSLGFGNSQFFRDKVVALKTGTSNQFGNIWALCSTMDYTVGVWGGNFNGDTVQGVPGAALPLEIASKIIDILPFVDKRKESPHSLVRVPVCSLSGEKPSALCRSITYEYINAKDVKNIPLCSYHKIDTKSGEEYVSYPTQYVHWAMLRGLLNKHQIKEVDGEDFEIIYPNNNAVYFFDPDNIENKQGITITIGCKNGGLPLFYSLNNNPLKPLNYPYKEFLQLKKGSYKIKVYSNNREIVKEVNFSIK